MVSIWLFRALGTPPSLPDGMLSLSCHNGRTRVPLMLSLVFTDTCIGSPNRPNRAWHLKMRLNRLIPLVPLPKELHRPNRTAFLPLTTKMRMLRRKLVLHPLAKSIAKSPPTRRIMLIRRGFYLRFH